MTKFLIIILVIFLIVLFILNYLRRSVKRIFSSFGTNAFNADNRQGGANQSSEQNEEVLYKKDDIVVLKGEAGDTDAGTNRKQERK